MKPIKELGLKLAEVGDNKYLIDPKQNVSKSKWNYHDGVLFDSHHFIHELGDSVVASVKPIEGLPLLVIEDEVGIAWEGTANDYKHKNNGVNPHAFAIGYKKAKETHQYTEDQMTAIRNKIVSLLPTGDVKAWDLIKAIQEYTRWFDEYVESLSQKELYIETENYCGSPLITDRCPKCVDSCDRAYHRPKIENNQIKVMWK